MPRITPKTNWTASSIPTEVDFIRIESNSQQAFDEIDELDAEVVKKTGDQTISGNLTVNNILFASGLIREAVYESSISLRTGYIKYDSGLMIVWDDPVQSHYTFAAQTVFGSNWWFGNPVDSTYPGSVTFTASPGGIVTLGNNGSSFVLIRDVRFFQDRVSVGVWNDNMATENFQILYTAIGKWK